MSAGQFRAGDKVTVCAADDFFAYVDGWTGRLDGYSIEGYAIVKFQRPDGTKTLFVPDAQLRRAAP